MIESDVKEYRRKKIKKIAIWCAVAAAITTLIIIVIFIGTCDQSIDQTNDQTNNGWGCLILLLLKAEQFEIILKSNMILEETKNLLILI